jgi:bifunctional N-acetylglucosamine-1-phosphate-uridyltransferase/glucosamine-1-phosphate-acetyltransferase GlmU-like protein
MSAYHIIYLYMSKNHIVIMAGGSGKRMGHTLPKQVLAVGHAPMLVHLLDLADRIDTDVILVLSKANRETVLNYLIGSSALTNLSTDGPNTYTYRKILVRIATQEIADGTGGAVRTARDQVFFSEDYDFDFSIRHQILVLSADVPLLSSHSALTMLNTIRSNSDLKCVIYAQERDDPHGYGRILMTPQGEISIVEQKDITLDTVNNVKLINTGIYAFEAMSLFNGLFHLNCNNAQGEYYLTDIPKIIQESCPNTVSLYAKPNFVNWDETMGANTPEQLEAIRTEYRKKFQILNLVLETDMTHSTLSEYMESLSELTTIGLKNDEGTTDIVREFLIQNTESINKHVFILSYDGWVIGTFSILIEPKVIHGMSGVAHVEDVVIRYEFRGCGLGSLMLNHVKTFCASHRLNIYKIILECSDATIGFYEKNGFKRVGNSMRLDL